MELGDAIKQSAMQIIDNFKKLTPEQLKIIEIVAEYEKIFYQDHKDTVEVLKQKRKGALKKFGELGKGDGFIERQLGEISDILFAMLVKRLSKDEEKYFRSKEGARWFYNYYPEYKTSELRA